MEQKKTVVTGGAGFIGSNLAKELAQRGYTVIIIDDLSTGRIENIQPLLKKKNVIFQQGSINDESLLKRLFSGIDYVFHLAAIPSVPRSIDYPQASHEINATGTLKVLIAAKDSGVKKVVYASSSSVYGDTPVLPKVEDMTPNPKSPYAVAKLTGEYYCRVFQEVYGLPAASLRYFNVYGPGQNAESQYAAVIPKFIKSIKEGKPPVIFGDGEQTRDFTFVKDVADVNILAAESNFTGIANVGAGGQSTVNYLAESIIKLLGSNLKPVYKPIRPGDVKDSLADISRARSFGYQPKYSLEQGLQETIKEFK